MIILYLYSKTAILGNPEESFEPVTDSSTIISNGETIYNSNDATIKFIHMKGKTINFVHRITCTTMSAGKRTEREASV